MRSPETLVAKSNRKTQKEEAIERTKKFSQEKYETCFPHRKEACSKSILHERKKSFSNEKQIQKAEILG